MNNIKNVPLYTQAKLGWLNVRVNFDHDGCPYAIMTRQFREFLQFMGVMRAKIENTNHFEWLLIEDANTWRIYTDSMDILAVVLNGERVEISWAIDEFGMLYQKMINPYWINSFVFSKSKESRLLNCWNINMTIVVQALSCSVAALIEDGDKTQAIIQLRKKFGAGLIEAKEVVEFIQLIIW